MYNVHTQGMFQALQWIEYQVLKRFHANRMSSKEKQKRKFRIMDILEMMENAKSIEQERKNILFHQRIMFYIYY